MVVDLALFEWTDGHPRLLGRITDPELVAHARERLAAQRRQELARLEPLRLVRDDHDREDAGEA